MVATGSFNPLSRNLLVETKIYPSSNREYGFNVSYCLNSPSVCLPHLKSNAPHPRPRNQRKLGEMR